MTRNVIESRPPTLLNPPRPKAVGGDTLGISELSKNGLDYFYHYHKKIVLSRGQIKYFSPGKLQVYPSLTSSKNGQGLTCGENSVINLSFSAFSRPGGRLAEIANSIMFTFSLSIFFQRLFYAIFSALMLMWKGGTTMNKQAMEIPL